MKKIIATILLVAMALSIATVSVASYDSISTNMGIMSLNNASVDESIESCLQAVTNVMPMYNLSPSDFNNVIVKGPYAVYHVDSVGDVVSSRSNYHVYYNGVFKGVIGLIMTENGLEAEYSIGYSDIPAFFDDNFLLIDTEDGLYCVRSGNNVCLKSYNGTNVLIEKEANINVASIATKISAVPMAGSKAYKINVLNNTYATRTSVTVPAVMMGSGSRDKCYHACMASTVLAHNNAEYPDITSLDVYYDTYNIDPNFASGTNVDADAICTMLETLYLDPDEHTTMAFEDSMTISSFKSIINNDRIIIALLYDAMNRFTHAVIMCGYITLTSGGIFANCMEPIEGTFVLREWTSGAFNYEFGSGSLTQQQMVISYY